MKTLGSPGVMGESGKEGPRLKGDTLKEDRDGKRLHGGER